MSIFRPLTPFKQKTGSAVLVESVFLLSDSRHLKSNSIFPLHYPPKKVNIHKLAQAPRLRTVTPARIEGL